MLELLTLDIPELRAKSPAERRRLLWLARARRGDAIWVIPLALGLLAGGFAMALGYLGLKALASAGSGAARPGGGQQIISIPGLLLAAGFPALILVFGLTRRVLLARSVLRLLVRTACPYCGFDLKGLTPVHDAVKCPECGQSVTLDELNISADSLKTGKEPPPRGAGPMGAYKGVAGDAGGRKATGRA